MRVLKVADELIAERTGSTPKTSPPPRSDKKALWSPEPVAPPTRADKKDTLEGSSSQGTSSINSAAPLVEKPHYSSKHTDRSELTVTLLDDEPGRPYANNNKQVDYDDDSQCAAQCRNACLVS